ncbi:thiolase family protein [Nocardioides sp. KIGAM211]|uniref:propanoyl-CoA C-acyltransferase n=1 Tax=Nocardioides luti TaxID=2761101 RepID=A0A7X0RFW5_9ACTN|nr:thiolase family protein [Nocardioides luti]MBB6627562.1 thiolase family protein [Nocardioides luti]
MRKVYVAGASSPGFGKLGRDAVSLGVEAVSSLLDSTGVASADVDYGVAGTLYGGSLVGQRIFQGIGVSGQPIFTVENACASGASAVHLAWQAVATGSADIAIAVGAENLTSMGAGPLKLTTRDIEVDLGVVMPATYAMRAQRYLHDFGVDASALSHVSVKNRRNGATNPRAHFGDRAVTFDEVEESRLIADPLRLFHCCPSNDGAAAVLLCTAEVAQALGLPQVEMLASVVRSGVFRTSAKDMTWPDITYRAASAAFEAAGLKAGDLDVVELHDAFTIAEFLHSEAMGLAERGTAHRAVAEGEFDIDGRVAVNPSGGLLSRGHPVGATGVAQLCESFLQLIGEAGENQVAGASVALTHVTGGGIYGVDNGACAVHILAV